MKNITHRLILLGDSGTLEELHNKENELLFAVPFEESRVDFYFYLSKMINSALKLLTFTEDEKVELYISMINKGNYWEKLKESGAVEVCILVEWEEDDISI